MVTWDKDVFKGPPLRKHKRWAQSNTSMSKVGLNHYCLRKGDIILTRLADDLSNKIQQLTDSKYSHASLCLTSTSIIEATLDGVNVFSPLHHYFNSLEALRVFRLKYENYSDLDSLLTRIEDAARDFSFRKYSTFGAIRAGKAKQVDLLSSDNSEKVELIKSWEKVVHCSQLVSLAYNIGAGIKLLENIPPELVTPGDIEKSHLLIDVTNEVTYKIDDEAIGGRKLYPNPLENSSLVKQTLIAQEALELLNPVLKELNINPVQDVMQALDLFAHLESDKASILDETLNRILKQVGFYDLGQEMERDTRRIIRNREWVKSKVRTSQITVDNKDDHLFEIDFLIQTRIKTIERQVENRTAYLNNYLSTGRLTFLSLANMTDHFINFCKKELIDSMAAKNEIERVK